MTQLEYYTLFLTNTKTSLDLFYDRCAEDLKIVPCTTRQEINIKASMKSAKMLFSMIQKSIAALEEDICLRKAMSKQASLFPTE